MARMERRIGWSIVIAGGLVLAGIVGAISVQRARALQYTLVFDDARSLRVGDRVQLGGVDIGEVIGVTLRDQPTRIEVALRIDPQHAARIRRDSTGIIRGATGLNVSGQKIVEILNPDQDSPAEPMQDDQMIEGVNGLVELQMWKLKQTLRGGKDKVVEKIGRMGDQIDSLQADLKELAASPRVQDSVAKLKSFMIEMKDKGKGSLVQLEEEWAQLREELAPVLEELKRFNREYLLRALRQLMDAIGQTLAEWRSEAGAGPTPTPTPTPAVAGVLI